jgi:hypothetical protein
MENARNFDILDMIIIEADPVLAPWLPKCEKVRNLPFVLEVLRS